MSTATAKLRPWDEPKAKPAAKAAPAPTAAPPMPAKSNSAGLIDELGTIRAEQKKLDKREKEIVEQVKAMGEGEHNGTKCKAVVSTSQTSRLDTTELKAVLPEEMIAKFTKSSPVTKVTIEALL